MPAKIDPRYLDEVERRYLNGQPTRQIERECADAFGKSRRNVQRYLAIVRKRLATAVASVSKDEQKARIEALVLGAYQLAATPSGEHGTVDPKAMIAAAKVLAEVHGVVGPRQVEISGRDGGAIEHAVAAKVVVLPQLEDDECGGETGSDLAAESRPSDEVPREPG